MTESQPNIQDDKPVRRKFGGADLVLIVIFLAGIWSFWTSPVPWYWQIVVVAVVLLVIWARMRQAKR